MWQRHQGFLSVCLISLLPLCVSAADKTIVFQTEPAGATVFLDNDPASAGITPCTVIASEDDHFVRFELKGYEPASKLFSPTGANTVVTAKLTAKPTFVTIESSPQKAIVMMDSVDLGPAPILNRRVEPGEHVLHILLKDYETLNETVKVPPGETTVYKFTLKKPGAPDAESEFSKEELDENGQPRKTIQVNCWVCTGKGVLQSMGCPMCQTKGRQGNIYCKTCSGTGRISLLCPVCKGAPLPAKNGEKPPVCKACNGKGGIACPFCKGTGKLDRENPHATGKPTEPCPLCKASGLEIHAKCALCAGGAGSSNANFFGMNRCRLCNGTFEGYPACQACGGRGYVGEGAKGQCCSQCFGTGMAGTPCILCKGKGWIFARPPAPIPEAQKDAPEPKPDDQQPDKSNDKPAGKPPKLIDVNCWVCNGTGLLQAMGCPLCMGKGLQGFGACPKCNGTRRISLVCVACLGTGKFGEIRCPVCKGKNPPVCSNCKGTGKMKHNNPEAFGGPTQPCPSCKGSGLEMHAQCTVCGGKGTTTIVGNGFSWLTTCYYCKGLKEGAPSCIKCQGTGIIGTTENPAYCPQCAGTGQAGTLCTNCKGNGWVPAPKEAK
jgi:DnaJ-class molecular chaperone